jgi:cobalt/nickel transport system permease protein
LKIYLKVMAVPAAFIALGSLSLLFSLSTADHHIHVVYAGEQMPKVISLIARALAAASCLCFLGLTTPASDWFPMLRRLHVPQIIVDIMFLVHRFLFIFVDRLETMHMAHESRLGYTNMRSTLRSSGMIGANLLVTALKRARSMEMGMASRCFTGEMLILPYDKKPSKTVLFIITLVWLGIVLVSSMCGR